jgi:aminopeptidase N
VLKEPFIQFCKCFADAKVFLSFLNIYMKLVLFSFFHSLLVFTALAQNAATDTPKEYRATTERINNLVHTKLDARFDYANSYLNGKVWLTLKPHFYSTDSLLLDAKEWILKA